MGVLPENNSLARALARARNYQRSHYMKGRKLTIKIEGKKRLVGKNK